MEIIIQKSNTILQDGSTPEGYLISVNTRTGKKSVVESDFFVDGSEIEEKVNQLKRLLKKYFDAQV
ncbi:hypothetical protein UFOVP822_44 [uncultured Caudovirales phage]|uniref:Uncharacterized protein n=1 Tax=uncultured Caudovirales phage TaxID=2100421 RepID=A0A6J5P287_9CAUD|nr:hypothetical protein UFOVP822_44 [uncultured Caudovirales phage]